MELPGRRSNYSLLSQFPDDPPIPKFDSPPPSDKNRGKAVADRMPAPFPSTGLQRQSSGSSSLGENSLSGDYYFPATLSTATATIDPDAFSPLVSGGAGEARAKEGTEAVGSSSSSSRSWAQQAEETYQLQLALALRLCNEAACANDPYFLDADDQVVPFERASAESMSHRFWVNGCLSYYDKIPDSFYLIQGIDPFVWTLCTDVQEETRIPSIESLRAILPDESTIEVALVDRQGDLELMQLQTMVIGLSCGCATTKDMVDQLAKLVCSHMGGSASNGEDDLLFRWRQCSDVLKATTGSVVFPIGKLSVGLCRHRALMFKILADAINLPCRVAKGCKYCKSDDASSCLVRFGVEREYLVDLIGNPGFLCDPDSSLNGPYSISISSPLHPPKFKSVDIPTNFSTLAKRYLMDCHSLNLMFNDASAGIAVGQEEVVDSSSKHYDEKSVDVNYFSHATNSDIELPEAHGTSQLPIPSQILMSAEPLVREAAQHKHAAQDGHRNVLPILGFVDPKGVKNKELRFIEDHQQGRNIPNKDMTLAVDGLDIPWCDLVLKEKIGAGSFGTVHRADWNGSDVAVKTLMEQDFHPERFKEFLREVAIMKSLRHPNIVLLMGAVTESPNLSIVTEYLSRGSLYRLLHRHGVREILDEKRRLGMALDVAKGMNYLHKHNPPIVHRDLKSPNLLVDKKYTVKVCDFGLSRFKANTYLSSKSLAGTPEWMAPEVLRDELSNEKSDVYSFGVILWELMTLQQPWSKLNPAQVVAAVGFKGRRLEIPSDVNPQIAAIMESCWADEPWRRPSFANIMDSLKTLQKMVHGP